MSRLKQSDVADRWIKGESGLRSMTASVYSVGPVLYHHGRIEAFRNNNDQIIGNTDCHTEGWTGYCPRVGEYGSISQRMFEALIEWKNEADDPIDELLEVEALPWDDSLGEYGHLWKYHDITYAQIYCCTYRRHWHDYWQTLFRVLPEGQKTLDGFSRLIPRFHYPDERGHVIPHSEWAARYDTKRAHTLRKNFAEAKTRKLCELRDMAKALHIDLVKHGPLALIQPQQTYRMWQNSHGRDVLAIRPTLMVETRPRTIVQAVYKRPDIADVLIFKITDGNNVALIGRDEVGQVWMHYLPRIPFMTASIEACERWLLGMAKEDVLVAQS